MTHAHANLSPVVALLPVANVQQQLVAFSLDSPHLPKADIWKLLDQIIDAGFFELLPKLFLIVPVKDLTTIPHDLGERLTQGQIKLDIEEAAWSSHDAPQVLAGLKESGFDLILRNNPNSKQLPWADVISISHDMATDLILPVRARVSALKSGTHWAKGISTLSGLADAQQAGFTLFSGRYALDVVPSNKINDGGARIRLLKLLGLVSRDADSKELEELFKQDAALSFMLFKLVSSAAFARTVKVTSFSQAITLIGRRQLQRWLQLLLYARNQEAPGSINPLMLRAAFRASMMEAIAKRCGASKDQLDSAFMVGMFSLLDRLFGCELPEILQPLNLLADVTAALMQFEGELGAQLKLVSLADQDLEKIEQSQLTAVGLDDNSFYKALIEAYVWVDQVCQEL